MAVAKAAPLDALAAATSDGPDEMGRELAGGPAAVGQTLRNVEDLRTTLDEAFSAAGRIVMVGTGASLAMIRVALPFWRQRWSGRPGVEVLVRQAADSSLGDLDGRSFGSGDLVVFLSQSGTTPETVASALAARAAGSRVVVLTGRPDSQLAGLGSIVVPIAGEIEGGASTRSELAALAALLAIGRALPEGADTTDVLQRVVASWDAIAAPAPRLAGAGRTWCLGFGSALGIAEAAALLWHEKVIRPAVAATPSEFRHGLIEAAGPRDAVILIDVDQPDPRRGTYLARLCTELAALEVGVVEIGADGKGPEVDGEVGEGPARYGLDAHEPAVRALEALLRVQQLARATALAAGTYRDGFAILRRVVQPATELTALTEPSEREEPRID